jgi:putative membrane protein
MSITHTFVDFIPSIFLGCPNSDTELSVLPGHQMLKKGLGYQAVMLSALGCLAGIFALAIFTIPLSIFIEKIYPIIKIAIPWILIGICSFMIFSESKKFSAFTVVIVTGILGYCVLNLDFKEPLLPLLGGLFGSSMIILSIKQKTFIPEQKTEEEKIERKKLIKPFLSAILSSPLCGFLPGVGSGQAAVIGSQIVKNDEKQFLFLLGVVNTFVMGISFISLYSIAKSRTGSAVAIQQLIGIVDEKILFLIITVCLLSGIISYFITKFIAKKFIKIIQKVNYSKMSKFILLILIIVTLTFSGIIGLIILIISTLTGIYCISLGVKRTHMMGCLLIPTIICYLI